MSAPVWKSSTLVAPRAGLCAAASGTRAIRGAATAARAPCFSTLRRVTAVGLGSSMQVSFFAGGVSGESAGRRISYPAAPGHPGQVRWWYPSAGQSPEKRCVMLYELRRYDVAASKLPALVDRF